MKSSIKERSLPTPLLPMIFKRNIRGIGLTYSNVNQQLKDHPRFTNINVVNGRVTETPRLPDHEEILRAIQDLPDNNPQFILVAQEYHLTGELHYHCYIQWLEPHDDVTQEYFDLWGMHPNIQQIRDQQDWINYCKKDDMAPLEWVKHLFDSTDDEGYSSPGLFPEREE